VPFWSDDNADNWVTSLTAKNPPAPECASGAKHLANAILNMSLLATQNAAESSKYPSPYACLKLQIESLSKHNMVID
jgi:hypothetical protein